MKLQQIKTGQYTITLPRAIVESIGWLKGDKLTLKLDKGKMIISKD